MWRVEKDVTSYLNWLLTEQTAYLSIPNNIDSIYTGIPLVNISLTFYGSDASNPPAEGLPTILPVSSAPANWNALEVTDGSNLTYTVTVPHNDVVGATLELMASPHGCEEFWYTNIDNEEAASKYGLCGGGVYRELQVYVDGILAGATYPMIVVYTGGINPFLWRPLTGIMSFDIPAYSFDLTPFVLGDGKAHEITVTVLGGDAEGGMWYLDAALKLYRDASSAPVTGGLLEHTDSGSNVTVASGPVEARGEGYGWNTTGHHSYRVRGQVIRATGTALQSALEVESSGRLEAWNTNLLSDRGEVETTNGQSTSFHRDALAAVLSEVSANKVAAAGARAASDAGAGDAHRLVESVAVYPYSMVSSYKQDASTMDMTATVNITYARSNHYAPSTAGPGYTISWSNSIWSDAAYNRSLDHATVYVESDNAAADYLVSSTAGLCYRRLADAAAGYVKQDTQEGVCDLPGGHYICGYELCTSGDGSSHGSQGAARLGVVLKDRPLTRTVGASSRTRLVDASETLPLVRHPLMGRARLTAKNRND